MLSLMPMKPKVRSLIFLAAILGVCILGLALGLVLVHRGRAPASIAQGPAPTAPIAPLPVKPIAAPAQPAAPTVATAAQIAGLRYLDRSGVVAVLDDTVGKQTHFVREGDRVLGAQVKRVGAAEVVLVADGREVRLPFSPSLTGEIRKPYDARAEKLPTVLAPGVDPAEVKKLEAQAAALHQSGGGGGGGNGGGRGRGGGGGGGGRGGGGGGGRGGGGHP